MSCFGSRNIRATEVDERSHILQEMSLMEEIEQDEMEEEMRLSWPDEDYAAEVRREHELDWQEEILEISRRNLDIPKEPLSCFDDADFF